MAKKKRSIEEIEKEISVFEKYGKSVPEKLMYEKTETLMRLKIDRLKSEIVEKLEYLFLDIKEKKSILISFTPSTGLEVKEWIKDSKLCRNVGKELFYINENRSNIIISAIGYYSEKKFVVQKGSKASVTIGEFCPEGYKIIRTKLIRKKILRKNGRYYTFTRDYGFLTAKMAAGIILGRVLFDDNDWKCK